jgi:hypothetical protein
VMPIEISGFPSLLPVDSSAQDIRLIFGFGIGGFQVPQPRETEARGSLKNGVSDVRIASSADIG